MVGTHNRAAMRKQAGTADGYQNEVGKLVANDGLVDPHMHTFDCG